MNKFNIGQQFKSRGKHPLLCTITDVLKTYNSRGELVKVRYVATHDVLGQVVTDYDVCETSISRGLVA